MHEVTKYLYYEAVFFLSLFTQIWVFQEKISYLVTEQIQNVCWGLNDTES